jgi:glycosyltransferase involved in cell wall biosynthesis
MDGAHVAAEGGAELVRMDIAPARATALSVFFPAFNEEGIIEETVRAASVATGKVADAYEIIVVDDGSRDRTAEIVESLEKSDPHVRLVRHGRNRGYGAALRTGFESARYDLVFFSDADGQFKLDELPGTLALAAKAPVVAGYRIKRNDPPHRLFIAKTYRLVVRLVFGLRVRDIDCAWKMFRREVLSGLNLESDGAFISSELLIKLKRANVPIVEIGVHHYPRTTGESKGATPKVILKTMRDIFRLKFGLPLNAKRA